MIEKNSSDDQAHESYEKNDNATKQKEEGSGMR